MSKILDDMRLAAEIEASVATGRKLIDRVGGRPVIEKVHKIFYDKLYADPWLGQFFRTIDQKHIEAQQTDFMVMLFGGPKNYGGRMPIDAHEHIMITEELFTVRQQMLKDSLLEARVPEKEMTDWLRVDGAFKKVLLKASPQDCKKRFKMDEILDFPNPTATRRAS